jgi:AcrR family transcriptional regulator
VSPLRERILAAAADRTAQHGWASVTMARLADDVGVSRQTIYNEVGGKDALAEAMVLAELLRFLAVVEQCFDEHPRDAVAATVAAASAVLSRATEQPLLRAIVSSDSGAQTELLPLLTTEAGTLLETSIAVVDARLARYPEVSPRARAVTADVVVRVVLSHVTQPTVDVPRATADIRWLARRLLATD